MEKKKKLSVFVINYEPINYTLIVTTAKKSFSFAEKKNMNISDENNFSFAAKSFIVNVIDLRKNGIYRIGKMQ